MTNAISLQHARQFALHQQLLDQPNAIPPAKEGVVEVISTLGYIQIDTLAVVERAHHHTLWTRCTDYNPQYLHELQAEDRRIFEYWGHAASFLPMDDYRYYLPLMKQYFDPVGKCRSSEGGNYSPQMKQISQIKIIILKLSRQVGHATRYKAPGWGEEKSSLRHIISGNA